MCCYDLSGLGSASLDPDSWSRRCCDNPSGHPVLRPEQELSPQQMKKVDTRDSNEGYLKVRNHGEDNIKTLC